MLNVKDELLNPREAGPLSHLFPEDVRHEATRRYEEIQAGAKLLKAIAFLWLALVTLCLIIFFMVCRKYKHSLKIWLPAIIVLGPIAFISRCIVIGNHKTTNWRKALTETLMNIIPIVVSYTLAITILILILFSGKASQLVQISMMFGFPLIIGLFFHLSYLSSYSSKGFGQFFTARLAQVLVSTFLGLGGIIPIAMPLINSNLVISLIAPLSPIAVISWWAIVAAGSIMGGLFIFLYEYWAVRKGFLAWNVLADGEGVVTTPSWRKIWWQMIISFAVLIFGLAAGIALTN